MAAGKHTRLTEERVARLRPLAREYTVWDTRVPGLGVRVRPSGGASHVLLGTTDAHPWRISLGTVTSKGIGEARLECHARLSEANSGGPAKGATPSTPHCSRSRRGCVDQNPLRPLLPIDPGGRPVGALQAPLAGVRADAARCDPPSRHSRVVRGREQERARGCELRARSPSPDPQLRGRLGPPRREPRAGFAAKPPHRADALSLAGRGPAPSPRARRARGEEPPREGSGRHHPPPPPHRMPPGGDRGASLARVRGGHARPRGCEGGPETRSLERQGARVPRGPDAGGKPVRLPITSRREPPPRRRSPRLGGGTTCGPARGRPPARLEALGSRATR